jgi:hypothetical protein
MTDLLCAGTIVPLKTIGYAICCRQNVAQMLSIQVFCVCAHASDGDNLLILPDPLLKLAEEDTQSWYGVSTGFHSSVAANVPPA